MASCSPSVDTRISIPRSKSSGLKDIDASLVYDKAITNKENIIVLLGIDNCSDCTYAKEQCNSYARLKEIDIFYLNFSNMVDGDYNKIYQASRYANEAYSLPEVEEEILLPLCYIFSLQGVISAFSDNFVSKLDTYIKVV
jgi:hypothetical protein